LDQVHAVSPRYARDTLVLFLVDTPEASPFGSDLSLECVGCYVLDALWTLQAPLAGTAQGPVSFTPRGVLARSRLPRGERFFGYDEVVVYRLSRQGEVTLLRELPECLLPSGCGAAGYGPVARLRPGPRTAVQVFGRPRWMPAPHDVLDCREGVLLGANWSGLEFHDGRLSRWARDGAEVLVNPAGRRERSLDFLVDAGTAARPVVVEA